MSASADTFFQQINQISSKPAKYSTEISYIINYVELLGIKTTCTPTHMMFDTRNVSSDRLKKLYSFVDVCFKNHQDPNKYKYQVRKLRDEVNRSTQGPLQSMFDTPIAYERTKLDSRRKIYVAPTPREPTPYEKSMMQSVRSYFTLDG